MQYGCGQGSERVDPSSGLSKVLKRREKEESPPTKRREKEAAAPRRLSAGEDALLEPSPSSAVTCHWGSMSVSAAF